MFPENAQRGATNVLFSSEIDRMEHSLLLVRYERA